MHDTNNLVIQAAYIREIVPVLLCMDYKMLKGYSYTIYEIFLTNSINSLNFAANFVAL